MKQLLFVSLMLISLPAISDMAPPPTQCKDNNWVEVWASQPKQRRPVVFCILPDGKYYNSWQLVKSSEYESLFEQFSGKQPSQQQIEEAKKMIRKEGYRVD